MPSIFLSHSHSDAALAQRFEIYLDDATSKRVTIHRSSKSGAIEYGDSWIDWINERVTESELSFIILTPSSFTSKWVLWEAGAVSGVRRAKETEGKSYEKRVIPIQFALPEGENLGPFQSQQIANGLNVDQVVAMTRSVLSQLRDAVIPGEYIDETLMTLREKSSEFVDSAKTLLRELQVYRREDLVQEWLTRIDKELAKDNPGYVNAATRWISVAFLGAGKAGNENIPIDFRLHVRLASGFIKLKNWKKAKVQLKLARAISPRDMLIQRELGRVEIELGNTEKAKIYLEEMRALDSHATSSDPEALNLYVRILISEGNWSDAYDVLQDANELAENDTYVANMLAIATLKDKGREKAKALFSKLEIMEKRAGSDGIWALGNLTNAALGQGKKEDAIRYLRQLRESAEAQRYRISITRYFDDIANAYPDLEFNWRSVWPEVT